MSTKKRRGDKDVPKKSTGGAKLRIEYDKVAYTTAYKHIAATVKYDFPKVECSGKAYPLPGNKQQWIYLLYVIQFSLAFLVTFAEDLAKRYDFPIDERWLELLHKNRYYLIPGIIMLSPVRQLLANSGAFQVYLNDELVYSALETRVPMTAEKLQELLQAKGIHPSPPK